MPEITRRHLQLAFAVCAGLGFVCTSYLLYRHQQIHNAVMLRTQQEAAAETKEAAEKLNEVIASLIPAAQSLADELGTKKLSRKEIEKKLRTKPVELYGLGIAFAPYQYSADQELYAPYYLELEGENHLLDVGLEYEYATGKESWFNKAMVSGAQFLEPYRGRASQATITEYAVPFYLPGVQEAGHKEPSGVVFANQSVGHLNHILSTLYSGATGYWFILARNGSIIAHPNKALADKSVTIFDIAKQLGNSALHDTGQKAITGKSVMTNYRNELSGAPSYLFGEPIQTTGWVLCRVFDKSELPFEKDELRRSLMLVISSTLLTLLLMVLLALTYAYTKSSALWLASSIASFTLAAGIGSLWYVAQHYAPSSKHVKQVRGKDELYQLAQKYDGEETIPLVAKSTKEGTTEQTAVDQLREITAYYSTTRHVPTGIFLTDLQFINPSQVSIVGYIWQRYVDKTHSKTTRGFVLPQAINTNIKELYRKSEGGTETILWSVEATINQRLNYRTYPFDSKLLEIEMWHADFDQNVLLLPDLDSYRLLNPRSKPGLGEEAYLEGWRLTDSAFGYLEQRHRALFGMYNRGLFGIYRQVVKSDIPNLSFNIRAERRLAETLFADLLPLIVVALLLFATFVASGEWGYASIGAMASVFFGTVFSHMRFREKIPAYAVVYFETFFFAVYAAIFIVVALATLYQLGTSIWFIRYRKNLISRLLYWPVLLMALVITTIYYLY